MAYCLVCSTFGVLEYIWFLAFAIQFRQFYLVKADFEAFKKDKGVVFHHDVNHYNIDGDQTLTDRAKEVMKNVCDFVMSYNFDDSDPMTDYFCTNFYLTLGVGTYKKPYKVELPKLDCKGKKPDVFKHPEGAAHKAIRQALGGAYFSFHSSQRLQGKMVLGEDAYGHSGDKYFWPLSYSSAKTAQKRMDKLEKAGIRCKLTGYNGGCIEFLGYTPETEALLEKERQEVVIAHQAWQAKQISSATTYNPVIQKMFDTPQSPLVRQKHCNGISNIIHDLINVK